MIPKTEQEYKATIKKLHKEIRSLKETCEILSDHRLVKRLIKSTEDIKAGRVMSHEEFTLRAKSL